MRVLLAVVGIVLAAPVLILVAIAFGPVALLIGALVATALVVTGDHGVASGFEPPATNLAGTLDTDPARP